MAGMLLHSVALIALALTGVAMMFVSTRRSAAEVIADLYEEDAGDRRASNAAQASSKGHRLQADDFTRAGLLTRAERRRFERTTNVLPLGVAAVLVVLHFLVGARTRASLVLLIVVGLALGYLVAKSRLRRQAATFQREIEFYLPMVMERMVMAVQAGLDVLPAIQLVTQQETDRTGKEIALDPVSRLLALAYQMTESGLGFRKALEDVGRLVESAPLRHAFIHIGLAQEQGGEVVTPLRELSDSTQLYYQESVEEEIAKLPVRATMPLLCTFTGLLIGFLTPPFIQIIETLKRMTASMGG